MSKKGHRTFGVAYRGMIFYKKKPWS